MVITIVCGLHWFVFVSYYLIKFTLHLDPLLCLVTLRYTITGNFNPVSGYLPFQTHMIQNIRIFVQLLKCEFERLGTIEL